MVDVNVNPNEPPLPGKVDYEQAKKFAQVFLKGQPRKATIATTLVSDKIEQLTSEPGASPPPLPRPVNVVIMTLIVR
jgi:hypothetical protein